MITTPRAIELLGEVLKSTELYDGKVGPATIHEIKTYLNAVKATTAVSTDDSKAALLADCRAQAERGDEVEAVKRFRTLTGCGLRAAHGAVTGKGF